MPHPPRWHPPPLSRHCLWLPPPTTVVNHSHPPWPMHAHQPQQQQRVPAQSTAHGDDDVAPLWVCHVIQMAMAARIGQVSRLYALPPFFSYLIATMPSGLCNTHQPPPRHLALCHLWHWQHMTTAMQWWWRQVDDDYVMWQWRWMTTTMIDDRGRCEEWVRRRQTTIRTCECSPPSSYPPLFTLM